MRFRKLKALGIAAVAASMTMLASPANAGSTDTTDAAGYDYDPACVVSTAVTTPPAPNSIDPNGCPGVSTHDGSAAALDIVNASAAPPTGSKCPPGQGLYVWFNATTGKLVVCLKIRGTLPAPGNTSQSALDLPATNFVGANYFWLFQNKTTQTNVPTNPVGGCSRIPTATPVYDQYGSHKDGYHLFVNYGVNWDGAKWVHSVQVGEYFPGPDGGFGFYELGTNTSGTWTNPNPYMINGVNWSAGTATDGTGTVIDVSVDGIFKTPDTTNCIEGFFKHAYAKAGDVIANVKGLTTANAVVTLPQSVPLSALCAPSGGEVCFDDLQTIGGFVFFADVTDGNSWAGLFNTNITGIAYTGGAIGVSDTLGDGPTCPTPTFGGQVRPNPLFTADTACQIDDDPVSRGSFLSEWWDTTHGFTA